MFTLNPELAVEGSEMGAGLIDTSGAYKGKIYDAKFEKASNNTEYLELFFERDDGAKAGYIKMYFKKKDGSEGFGSKQIHALMTCLKLRQLNNFEQLKGLKVGLILQREDYIKKDGIEGFSMKLVAPFDYDSMKTAAEVLKNQPASAVNNIVETLVDKKAKARPAQNQQSNNMDYTAAFSQQQQQPQQQQQQQQQQNSSFDNFNDDLPF